LPFLSLALPAQEPIHVAPMVLPQVPEIASAAGVQGQVQVSAKVDPQKGRSPILKQQQAGKSCATLQQQNIQK
jgi:hypothetical protein